MPESPSQYEARRAAREARHAADVAAKAAGLPTTHERNMANRRGNIGKAQAALKLKREARELVRQKVAAGLPITEEEREKLAWRSNVVQKSRKAQEEATLAAATKLLISPSNVKDLRALVEKVANKHHYNPLEELIIMTQVDPTTGQYRIPADERAQIHKSLLPYLTPQLKVAPAKEEAPQDHGVKVSIKSFVLPPAPPKDQKIYDQARNSSVTPSKEPLDLSS